MKLRAFIVSVAVAASTASIAQADPAHDHYTVGRDSYRAGLYGRALEEFELSYEAAPSPNTQLYVARSLRELGRWAEAAEHFRATIREAEERGAKYAAAREAAQAELRDVEVRIERAEPPKVEAPPAAPAPPPVVDIRKEEPPSKVTTTTWVSGGVAIAGAAVSGLFYGLASNRYAYLEDHCTRTRDASCDDARGTGRTEEGAAYVALGVAVVAAGVAIVSFVISSTPDSKPRAGRPWLLAF